MTKASPIQTNFTAGEWSPLMQGHINIQKFADSAQLIQNLICLKQGAVTRRGGTRFVKEVKNSAHNTVLIPFEFNIEQAYQIEAGDEYFRFFADNAVITESAQNITGVTQADPAVLTYDGADNYTNGKEVYISGVAGMTELNGKFYKVANVDTGANTFELQDIDGNDIDSSAYTAYSSGGTVAQVYEIATPYQQEDLLDSNYAPSYQYAQSADVLYLVHGSYTPRALVRTSNTNWTLNEIEFNDGPYLPENDTATTFTITSGTLTASSTTGINGGQGFLSTDVGRLIRIKDGSDWKWGVIDSYTSTTEVEVTNGTLSGHTTSATTSWRMGVYSETTGYPRVVSFFQDRILFAGCDSYPDRYDLSRTGGYSDTDVFFAPSDADGTVTDDAAITGTLQSGRVNAIQWAGSDSRGLLLGTAEKEWIVRPDANNGVLTPSNSKADPISSVGSAYIQPVDAESGTVYVQRARRKILDIVYNINRDELTPRDLSILGEHLSRTGLCEIKVQQEPINCIWGRRTDGLLIGFTYYPDEQVFAFHRHPMGGSGIVRSISTIPSSDTSRDELWLITERTINGTTRKYIEYMERYYESDIDKEDAFCVDSGLTYDSSATATVTGLDHLEGETVKVMVDGNSHPDLTVTNGTITLANDRTGSVIQAGLGYTWALKTYKLEAGAQDGTAQGKTKRITNIVVRLLNALGLYYGPDASTYDEYDFNQGAEYDETLALYSGDTLPLKFPNGYDQKGEIYLQHDGVFPITILAIMPQVVTQDR